jgi:hypothetical protein
MLQLMQSNWENQMIEIKPTATIPDAVADKFKIFLAGSIEMGTAAEWQLQLAFLLAGEDIVILNPRRDNWDSSWVQSIDNPQFKQQVTWEMDHLDIANLNLFYFDPATKSPITLMELGMHARGACVVCCPEGFHRKGNVDIVCERFRIPMVKTVEELATYVKVYRELKWRVKPLVKDGIVETANLASVDFLVRAGILCPMCRIETIYGKEYAINDTPVCHFCFWQGA